MTSGIGGLGSFSSAQFEKMFTRIDTNADGAVTRDEFIAGAPDDVSADKAGSLFDKLDGEGSGALSQSDLATAFQQMAATMQAGMIQAQAGAMGGGGERPDASELFAKLDTDGDGSVSREEFVAGRPDEVSEEQASAFFDKIAGEDTDSIDQQSFVAAMQKPPSPPGGGGGRGGGQSDEAFDALDTNQDGVVTREEFLAGRPDDVSEEQASALFESLAGEDAESITAEQFAAGMQGPPPPSESDMAGMSSDDQELVEKLLAALEQGISATSGETGNSALQQLMSAIEAYTKSQQSGSLLYSNSTVSALSLSA